MMLAVIRGLPAPALARLATGLGQGLLLYLLYLGVEHEIWPARQGLVLVPLLMLAWFIPIILLLGLGNLRPRTLLAWVIGAAIMLAGLAIHDATRGGEGGGGFVSLLMVGRFEDQHPWPSLPLVLLAIPGLFIAHVLIAAGDGARRIIADYAAYFDAAWKTALQLALAAAFVVAFWLLLLLGTGLFSLIKIYFFETLIQHRWFAMPATTLALACALHLTDARAGVVRGLRVLVHVLLSSLLPLFALVVAGFLATLPFTGLDLLWQTHLATPLLLVSAASLLILINAAYQDGAVEHRPGPVLRHAGRLAALMPVPLVAIAAYGMALRVAQHGWSTDRVMVAATLLVAACYALGYAAAAVRPGAWLKGIEGVNLAGGVITLGVILALLSPIADPARIAVASQVARLENGSIDATAFDYAFLRFGGARYGRAALEQLNAIEGPNAALIRERAEAALRLQNRWAVMAPTAQELAASITVHPEGRMLPQSFVDQDWASAREREPQIPRCLVNRSERCDALLIDLDGDGVEEVVLTTSDHEAIALEASAEGKWRIIGTFYAFCSSLHDSFRSDQVKIVAPQWQDLDLGGRRVQLERWDLRRCSPS